MNSTISLRARCLAFHQTLVTVLPARNRSDRTCFRRITRWLQAKVASGEMDEAILHEALTLAKEATGPTSKNPAAVFVALMKTEIGYDPDEARSLETPQ